MNINTTGDGLNILIYCDYVPHHNWMSYFCWYSISKNLPDAKVMIDCNRTEMKYSDFFTWTRRCNVPFRLHKEMEEEDQILSSLYYVPKPVLVIPPYSVCVRDFEEAGFSPDSLLEVNRLDDRFSCDCREERSCFFATYFDGWGKFVTSSWINKVSSPFLSGVQFNKGNLTTNEVRIGRLWNAATPLFQTISR